jgi:hypothetical protein
MSSKLIYEDVAVGAAEERMIAAGDEGDISQKSQALEIVPENGGMGLFRA